MLLANLPLDAALYRHPSTDETPWTRAEQLLADLFHALTGEAHPSRPKADEPSKKDRYRDLRARLEQQRKRRASTTTE